MFQFREVDPVQMKCLREERNSDDVECDECDEEGLGCQDKC